MNLLVFRFSSPAACRVRPACRAETGIRESTAFPGRPGSRDETEPEERKASARVKGTKSRGCPTTNSAPGTHSTTESTWGKLRWVKQPWKDFDMFPAHHLFTSVSWLLAEGRLWMFLCRSALGTERDKSFPEGPRLPAGRHNLATRCQAHTRCRLVITKRKQVTWRSTFFLLLLFNC